MADLLVLYNPYYQKNVIETHLEVLKNKGQVAFGKVRSKLKDTLKNQNSLNQNSTFTQNQSPLNESKFTQNQHSLNKSEFTQNQPNEIKFTQNHNLTQATNTDSTAFTANENSNKFTNTELDLPRLQSLLNAQNSGFLQLFLTDYASLYVAKVVDIVSNADESIVPSYYKDKNLNVECFFIINDLREIVRNDFACVRDKYLANFTTSDYENHTYALYGNSYVYPLIVEQKQEMCYFESNERHFLQLFKSEDFLRQKQTLIDYAFGEGYFYAMHPDSFDNVIYAELEFHANKHDRLYDFSGVILRYAKCFETECHLLACKLVRVLASKDGAVLRLKFGVGNKVQELSQLPNDKAMLGAYGHIFDKLLKRHIERHLSDEFKAFCKKFIKQIAYMQGVRNPVAHCEFARLERASELRTRLIGVGMPSQLIELIKARVNLLKE